MRDLGKRETPNERLRKWRLLLKREATIGLRKKVESRPMRLGNLRLIAENDAGEKLPSSVDDLVFLLTNDARARSDSWSSEYARKGRNIASALAKSAIDGGSLLAEAACSIIHYDDGDGDSSRLLAILAKRVCLPKGNVLHAAAEAVALKSSKEKERRDISNLWCGDSIRAFRGDEAGRSWMRVLASNEDAVSALMLAERKAPHSECKTGLGLFASVAEAVLSLVQEASRSVDEKERKDLVNLAGLLLDTTRRIGGAYPEPAPTFHSGTLKKQSLVMKTGTLLRYRSAMTKGAWDGKEFGSLFARIGLPLLEEEIEGGEWSSLPEGFIGAFLSRREAAELEAEVFSSTSTPCEKESDNGAEISERRRRI